MKKDDDAHLVVTGLGSDAVFSGKLLEVRRDNAAAQALYRSRGFEVVAERRGYYDDGEDALVMRCALEGSLLGAKGAVYGDR